MDFGLRVSGKKEFLAENSKFDEISYIMDCKSTNKRPELILDILQDIDDEEEEELEEEGDFQTFNYNHEQIAMENKQWDEMTYISIWEMKKRLSLRILGCDNITTRPDTLLYEMLQGASLEDIEGCTLYATIGLFHGGTLMAPLVTTGQIPADPNPRWNERVEFNIAMCDIPRNAKLCMTIFAKYNGKIAPVGFDKFYFHF